MVGSDFIHRNHKLHYWAFEIWLKTFLTTQKMSPSIRPLNVEQSLNVSFLQNVLAVSSSDIPSFTSGFCEAIDTFMPGVCGLHTCYLRLLRPLYSNAVKSQLCSLSASS